MRTEEKSGKKDICYICGKEGADTVDHVPPKAIFPKNKWKENLITVRAHFECNNLCSKDDEYFRDKFVIAAAGVSKEAAEIFNTKMIRAFQREQAKFYRRYFLEQISSVEIRSPSGLYLKELPVMLIEEERIDSVIKRICRGLYFIHTSKILPVSCPIAVNRLYSETIAIRNHLNEKKALQTVIPGVFEYFHLQQNDDADGNFFFLFFYNCFTFQVSTGKVVDHSPKTEKIKNYDKFEGIKFTKDTLWFPPGYQPM